MRVSERLEQQADEAETVASQLSLIAERQALLRFARDWRKLAEKAREREAREAFH
jgi:hypothetical protein